MDRSAAARLGLAAGLLLAPLLLPAAQATHAPLSLPLREDHPRVREALDWFAVRDDGCVHHPDFPPESDRCPTAGVKWVAVMAASVGADPATWPRPDASVGDWLLAHADDLREEADDCNPSSGSEVCRQQAVFSRAKSLLAFAAAGVDPRAVPLPDGGTRDLVAELDRWYRGGQYGGSGFVSDDVFALVALNTVNHTSEHTREAADLVASTQGPDGGVGWEVGGSPSPELTGAALQALAPRDHPAFVDDALAYLEGAQNRTGPHRACWDRASPDAGNTAWALLGLVAAGEDPRDWAVDGQTPTGCLASLQAPDGGFRPSPDAGASYIATHEALAGLAWAPYGEVRGPEPDLQRRLEARLGEPSVLADDPDATVRTGNTTRASLAVDPAEPGPRTLHGLAWTPHPRPVTYRVDVRPPIPELPGIAAPRTHAHPAPVPANLTPGGAWTENLRLVLPNGTVRAGAHHLLPLEPGLHRLQAWALNARGEAGPPANHTVLVRDPAPEVAVRGPSQAAPDANVSLEARARDPGGEDVTLRWTTPEGDPLARGPTVTLTPDPGGNRTVVAVATDAGGATARARHTVAWTSAGPNLTVAGPHRSPDGAVNLTARASHPHHDVKVTWHLDGDQLARGPRAALALPPGNHTLRVVAATPDASVERLHAVTVAGETASPSPDGNVSGPDPGGAESDGDPRGPGSGAGEQVPAQPAGAPGAARQAPGVGLAGLLAGAGLAAGRRRSRNR